MAISTALLVAFTYRLWKSTDKLWGASTKQLEIEQRPWISVDAEIHEGLTWKDGVPKLVIHLTIKNLGKSPAIGLYIVQRMSLAGMGGDIQRGNIQDELSADALITQRGKNENALYHGSEPYMAIYHADLPQEDAAQFRLRRDPLKTCSMGFVGCVDYFSPFDEARHFQTGFWFHLFLSGPKGTLANPYFEIDKDVPVEQLALARAPFGNWAR
jgi:hypothetical protein